jgi:hypothetical protein
MNSAATDLPADATGRVAGGRSPNPNQNTPQARRLADAIGKTSFQNASYYPGPYDQLAVGLKIG